MPIVPHPNYTDGVKVWHDENTDPPRVHVCPPEARIIHHGKWRGFTFKEAAEIKDHVETTHRKYLDSLREKFKSPYV